MRLVLVEKVEFAFAILRRLSRLPQRHGSGAVAPKRLEETENVVP